MNEYRDLAFEAITTLGVVVDVFGGYMGGDCLASMKGRANNLAMKLAVYDSDALEEELLGKQGGGRPCADEDISEHATDSHAVCIPAVDIEPKPFPAVSVAELPIKLPGVEPVPLPNDHPIDLRGSGRAGKPTIRFKMRELGGDAWSDGTAGELANAFGVTPSQIYKWANGKARSGKFEVVKL